MPELPALASIAVTTNRRLRRVGHKGADLIAPGNTHASFDAALAAGVDVIEFDVLPSRADDSLLLAHDYIDADERTPPREALGVTGVITNDPRLFSALA